MSARRSTRGRRSSQRPGRGHRPGFEPRGQRGIPPWIWIIGAVVIILLLVGALLIFTGRDGEEVPTPTSTTPSPTSTATPTLQAPTATPEPTPTLETRECEVIEEGVTVWNEPREESVGQNVHAGQTVDVIDRVEEGGRSWYRIFLPWDSTVRYIPVEAVECE